VKRRVAAAAVIALGCMLASCKQTAGLARQELVVQFRPGATQADHERVWRACPGGPRIVREPLDTTSSYAATLLNNVRYRVDTASNYDLAQLIQCLQRDPSVAGYSITGGDNQ